MREPIANLARWLERSQENAALSRPVSYRDLSRFFLWRGGYALAGPVLVVLVSPLTAGVGGALSLWGGLLGLVFVSLAGCARALDRPSHAAGFGVLALCALSAPVAWIETAGAGVSTAFAAGIALLFAVVSVPVSLLAFDTVRRELATS